MRVSLFGGGTDYPVFFEEFGGAVLGMAVEYYSYIAVSDVPDNQYMLRYSENETVNRIDEIRHQGIKACLLHRHMDFPIQISHMSDMPTRAGLGTSSSFTVGLLHALSILLAQKNNNPETISPTSPMVLIKDAWHVERDLMGETVGSQDQVFAVLGGLRRILFEPDHTISTRPILNKDAKRLIEDYLYLIPTGYYRTASEVAKKQVELTPSKQAELLAMKEMVEEGRSILEDSPDPRRLGRLLMESWLLKKGLTDRICPPNVEVFLNSIAHLTYGLKLIGAGGGGTVLVCMEPSQINRVKTITGKPVLPIRIAQHGSRAIVE